MSSTTGVVNSGYSHFAGERSIRFTPLEATSAILSRAIRSIDVAVRTIRQARTAGQLVAAGDDFSALEALLGAAGDCALQCCDPLVVNYQAHLETLSFELHRAHSLLVREHARLGGGFHP